MRRTTTMKLLLILAMSAAAAFFASEVDHREFEATLHAPYRADGAGDARTFTLNFDYQLVQRAQDVTWRLELVGPAGQVVQRWQGVERLFRRPVDVKVNWAGRDGDATLPDGVYQVRMQAVARNAPGRGKPATLNENDTDRALAAPLAEGEELVEQSWDIGVGQTAAPAMPGFRALATSASTAPNAMAGVRASMAATASLPYTVYFGNLHSQTNHSDGGGAIATCTGAQAPQSAALGPTDAYTYAMNKG